jgi:hypothetical protein
MLGYAEPCAAERMADFGAGKGRKYQNNFLFLNFFCKKSDGN